jgi:tRNA 2-thiocytidine biosynthesis protein TtcA
MQTPIPTLISPAPTTAEPRFITPPKPLLRLAGKAIADFQMINAGDRILVGVSGGKDSLSLLHILYYFQRHAPIRFEFAAVTVDPQVEGFEPATLKPYMQALGIPYFFRSQAILEQAKEHIQGDSFCAYCSRMKRGIIYNTARAEGYNTIALAQHLDDLAESFLMSAFHGGRLQTMKANYRIRSNDLRVIRPLVYVRERQTADFARAAGLPVVPDSCPACFRMPATRVHMKLLLAQEEKDNRNVFKSLLQAMRPLYSKSTAGDNSDE